MYGMGDGCHWFKILYHMILHKLFFIDKMYHYSMGHGWVISAPSFLLNIITHSWSNIFGGLAQTPLKLGVEEYRWLG